MVDTLCLLKCAGQLWLRNHVRQVEKRPRDRCNGNAFALLAIAVGQVAGHVHRDMCAAPARTAEHGDVDARTGSGAKLPQRRGTSMREHRIRADSQHRRKPVTVGGQRSVTDRVDAAMDPEKPRCRDPALDPPPTEAERAELVPGHQPVLAARDAGHGAIGVSPCSRPGRPVCALCRGGKGFPLYVTVNICHPWRVGAAAARVTRETSGITPNSYFEWADPAYWWAGSGSARCRRSG
jgi:hypothetical protein